MKLPRRQFLHFAAGTATLPATQQIAKAQQTTPAQAPLDPLVWPVVPKIAPEMRSFAGHTNTVPDIVGGFGTPASLVVFTEGNHLMVLHSEDILGAFPSSVSSQSQYADLNLDKIILLTLPQPIVVQTIRSGAIAFGNLSLEFTRASGYYPDIVMGGPAPLQELRKLGLIEPQARAFSKNRGRALVVRKGNPLRINGLSDVARTGARLVQADAVEAAARAGNFAAVEALVGKTVSDTILAHELIHFPGRLGITHRDVPEALARGYADVGLRQYHPESLPRVQPNPIFGTLRCLVGQPREPAHAFAAVIATAEGAQFFAGVRGFSHQPGFAACTQIPPNPPQPWRPL